MNTSPAPPGVRTLAFRADKVAGGARPVLAPDGRPVALIETRSFTRRFVARTPDGQLLCSGRARRLLRRYEVHDGRGALMLTMRTPVFTSKRRVVRFANGKRITLHRRAHADWSGRDHAGNEALLIERTRERRGLPDEVAHVRDPRWGLPLIVAVVTGNHQDEEKTSWWELT